VDSRGEGAIEREKRGRREGPRMSKQYETPTGLVKMLISELDSNLFDFFAISECQDYLFCHR
jgi:hypothetical protein